MIHCSGPAKIIEGPTFYNHDGKYEAAEVVVEIKKGQTLQLISPNFYITKQMKELQIGQSVHFEGFLDSELVGYYFITLSSIKVIKAYRRKSE